MKNVLSKVLAEIGEDYKGNIQEDSRYYLEISIAKKAAELGFSEITKDYKNVYAIVPLKQPLNGMKVRIDGRTFVEYAQFESGIVVPNYVASQVDMPHRTYVARISMICNYT
jgi:hypothetical protein